MKLALSMLAAYFRASRRSVNPCTFWYNQSTSSEPVKHRQSISVEVTTTCWESHPVNRDGWVVRAWRMRNEVDTTHNYLLTCRWGRQLPGSTYSNHYVEKLVEGRQVEYWVQAEKRVIFTTISLWCNTNSYVYISVKLCCYMHVLINVCLSTYKCIRYVDFEPETVAYLQPAVRHCHAPYDKRGRCLYVQRTVA